MMLYLMLTHCARCEGHTSTLNTFWKQLLRNNSLACALQLTLVSRWTRCLVQDVGALCLVTSFLRARSGGR
eukprot:8002114-Karenia_brevis.AAC.1